ncbi:tyrosine-type recombinase/integrase [Phocaeicola vulgatus]|nr:MULTISPECIES: tyrosine-type recombinase/integrase [Bacteroidaceae]MCR1856285.1 tyrosine-type recombinase/integrase [Phocaeicola vulgatus]
MQNTVYECKQNGEDFFLSLSVTCSRFGNCPANGLVTEQPQYSVVVCIFSTWQNTEMSLISNGLRLIFTCSLSLALPCIFHLARHSFATEICLTKGVPIESVSKMLGHTNIQTTQIYARVVDRKLSHDMNMLDRKLKSMQKGTTQNAV